MKEISHTEMHAICDSLYETICRFNDIDDVQSFLFKRQMYLEFMQSAEKNPRSDLTNQLEEINSVVESAERISRYFAGTIQKKIIKAAQRFEEVKK